MDNQKLYEALKTIQEECKGHQDCKNCPMGNAKGRCHTIETTPDGWSITKTERLME